MYVKMFIKIFVKRVLLVSTFFVCVSVSLAFSAYAFSPSPSSSSISATAQKSSCPKPKQTQEIRVKWVYDGDTLKLADNRKLRIIGIDTPEVARKRKTRKKEKKKRSQYSEPYAGQATEALRELLAKHNNRIYIETGKEKKDKYGRLLAYVFTPNGINVSEWLLQQGLATLLVIPPNDRYLDCFRKAERQAQKEKRNIWKLSGNEIKNTSTLDSKVSGYVRLEGTVKRIKRRKNKISITLDHQIYITIKKPDISLFKDLDVTHLKGRTIQVTGRLYRHGKKGYIRLRHPVYLDTTN